MPSACLSINITLTFAGKKCFWPRPGPIRPAQHPCARRGRMPPARPARTRDGPRRHIPVGDRDGRARPRARPRSSRGSSAPRPASWSLVWAGVLPPTRSARRRARSRARTLLTILYPATVFSVGLQIATHTFRSWLPARRLLLCSRVGRVPAACQRQAAGTCRTFRSSLDGVMRNVSVAIRLPLTHSA